MSVRRRGRRRPLPRDARPRPALAAKEDDDEASLELDKTDAELKAREDALWREAHAANVGLGAELASALHYMTYRDAPIQVRVHVVDQTRTATAADAPPQTILVQVTGLTATVQAVRGELTARLKRGAGRLGGVPEEIEVHSPRAKLRPNVPLSDHTKLCALWSDAELLAGDATLEARITERSPPPSPRHTGDAASSDGDILSIHEHDV